MDAIAPPFRWWSPLGASAALFLSYTIFCGVIGVAGPIYLHSGRECTIDVQFDLVLTDLTSAPAAMPELGCALTTSRQRAHLVQKGPVRMCERSIAGAFWGR